MDAYTKTLGLCLSIGVIVVLFLLKYYPNVILKDIELYMPRRLFSALIVVATVLMFVFLCWMYFSS
jgi:hypothetical protein